MNQKIQLAHQRLDAKFSTAEANREARTVPLTFYSGATVLQFNWENGLHNLKLSLDQGHVRMTRLQSGAAPFTRGHASPNDPGSVVGVIENAAMTNNGGKATVRFSKRADVEPLFADVLDGILQNVSVEASLYKLKEITANGDKIKTFLATDWEPYAVAIVANGADPGAHISAAQAVQFSECELETTPAAAGTKGTTLMNTTEQTPGSTADYAATAAEIRRMTTAANSPMITAQFAEDLISRKASLHDARVALSEILVEEQMKTDTRIGQTCGFTGGTNEHAQADRMAEALFCRYTGKAPSDAAREFMGARITDMARICCQNAGLRPPMAPGALIELAMHNSADFPYLLQESGRRQLLDAYTASQSKLKLACRRSTFTDFRTKAALRLGEAPKLVKIPAEGAQITYGTRAESKESYRGWTFARIFSITREALINDDLGAFADFTRAWGTAASSLEAQEIVDLLASNPTMTDTKALFHADHGNLNAAPGAISDTTLTAARLALRTMKGVDAETIIEATPKYLVVPAALETTAEKYLATLYPAQASSVNPFSGKLELIVEPRLDAKSATGWYVFGDPALCPVIEYAYLSGAEGPQVSSREGWEYAAMEFRCLLDFGTGAIDYKGAYKGNS